MRDIQDARRLLTLLAGEEDLTIIIEPPDRLVSRGSIPKLRLLQRAGEILADRRRRVLRFGKGMFGEPAWDILLQLYISEGGHRQTISAISELSGASRSTALRWIDYLDNRELISRKAHPTDRRMAFVELTDKGRVALELYLSDTLDTDE